MISLPVTLKADESTLSSQQKMVLEQKRLAFNQVDTANSHLDQKALAILQSGTLVVVLTGALSYPATITSPSSPWLIAGLVAGFASFAVMVGLSVRVWASRAYRSVGGSSVWDTLYKDYIFTTTDECFAQVIADLIAAIDSYKAINREKGKLLNISAALLVVQIAGALAVALLS